MLLRIIMLLHTISVGGENLNTSNSGKGQKKRTDCNFLPGYETKPVHRRKMPKKDAKISPAVASSIKKTSGAGTSSSTTTLSTPNSIGQPITDLINAINTTYKSYINSLTPRLKLIDVFLTFLVLLGVLQFVYVILIGNFPFNAFLGGFISCVGQFVLTVSLRLQYENLTLDKKKQAIEEEVEDDEELVEDSPKAGSFFESISPERALGDYVFASLILHFIVYHFIN